MCIRDSDIPPDYIKQICHPNRDIKTVTCLLCDNGYCKSEFLRKVAEGTGFFFVSRHIVVCPAHPNLTYKTIEACDQNNGVESLILNRKLLLLQKHLENIASGMNIIQEVESMEKGDNKYEDDDAYSVKSEKSKKRKVEYNNLDKECDDCHEYIKELSYEKKMNIELVKQNEERGITTTF